MRKGLWFVPHWGGGGALEKVRFSYDIVVSPNHESN